MDAYALLISKIPRRKFMSATNSLPLHVLKPIRSYSKSVNDVEDQEQHSMDFSKAPSLADEFKRVAEEKAEAARQVDRQNGTDTEKQRNAAGADRTSSTDEEKVFAGSSEDGRNANRCDNVN